MGDHDVDQRIRLVALGGGGVGKTSIIKRFLFDTFDDKHRSTVEDLYCREFHVGALTIKVDILDTAGDLQFPAMRRLSVATANAFLLVYSVDSEASFELIKQCFEEIREQRADFQEIPTVVVGNKCDVLPAQVRKEDAAEWVYCELPRMRTKVLECSAKTSCSVGEVFRSFLNLAHIPPSSSSSTLAPTSSALKRRCSEYGHHGGHGSNRSDRRPSPSPLRNREAALRSLTAATTTTPGGSSGGAECECEESFSRLKPRSRSLIRRSSKKTPKLAGPTATEHGDDCAIC